MCRRKRETNRDTETETGADFYILVHGIRLKEEKVEAIVISTAVAHIIDDMYSLTTFDICPKAVVRQLI